MRALLCRMVRDTGSERWNGNRYKGTEVTLQGRIRH